MIYEIFCRHGHANLAFKMSRIDAPLGSDKTIELGHHILKVIIMSITYTKDELCNCTGLKFSDKSF